MNYYFNNGVTQETLIWTCSLEKVTKVCTVKLSAGFRF